ESVATLLLLCDPRDLGTAIGERPPSPGMLAKDFTAEDPEGTEDLVVSMESTRATGENHGRKENSRDLSASSALAAVEEEFFEPNLYLYDAYPGGIGFSEPLYRVHELVVRKTRELIAACPCEKGCPSCVGAVGEKSEHAKAAALAILEALCGFRGKN
ncbi:MAG: Zn-binding domain-containing protein, partial [Candidatus Acidiferrales bacterium]